jgi:hypothetical protein
LSFWLDSTKIRFEKKKKRTPRNYESRTSRAAVLIFVVSPQPNESPEAVGSSVEQCCYCHKALLQRRLLERSSFAIQKIKKQISEKINVK